MTEQNTEIEGQQTTGEAVETQAEGDENPTADDAPTDSAESPDSASGNPETTPDTSSADSPPANATTARTTDAYGADDAPVSQPAGESADDTPAEHRYRVVHEESNPGDPNPHSKTMTEPMEASAALEWLISHARTLGVLAEDLSKFL